MAGLRSSLEPVILPVPSSQPGFSKSLFQDEFSDDPILPTAARLLGMLLQTSLPLFLVSGLPTSKADGSSCFVQLARLDPFTRRIAGAAFAWVYTDRRCHRLALLFTKPLLFLQNALAPVQEDLVPGSTPPSLFYSRMFNWTASRPSLEYFGFDPQILAWMEGPVAR